MINMRTALLFATGLVAVAAVLILPTTTAAMATTINIVNDNKVAGTDYILLNYDTTTKLLTIRNDNKGTVPGTIDFTKTVFRNAQLDKYSPNDPYNPSDPYRQSCYNFAIFFNGVSTSDDMGSTLGNMAYYHCGAKVLVDSKTGIVKSFRPVYSPQDPY